MTNKTNIKIIHEALKQKPVLGIPQMLIKLLNNGNQAILLNQILYWSNKTKNEWVYKTYDNLSEETGLSASKLRTAKKALEDKDYIETFVKRSGRGLTTVNYKIKDKLKESLEMFGNVKNDNPECNILQSGMQDLTNRNVKIYNPYNTIDYIQRNNTKSIISREYKHKITDIEKIFEAWNNSKIVRHFNFTDEMKNTVDDVLNYISTEELLKAIENYSTVINNKQYYFTTRWSLIQFIQKGLQNNSGFSLFLDESAPLDRFKNNIEVNSVFQQIKEKFKPTRSEYDEHNVADFDRNTYYGFDLDIIKNPWNRISSVAHDIKRKIEWDKPHLWQLELCIAAFFYHRKNNNINTDQVQLFFDTWKETLNVR